jgi:hypothetical protein
VSIETVDAIVCATGYDVEADSTKMAYDMLTRAVNAGKVRQNNTADSTTSQSFFLDPLTPYIKRADVHP